MGRVISNLLRTAGSTNVISMTVSRRFFALGRWPSAALAIAKHSRKPGAVVHVHLAGGGSIVREGALAGLSAVLRTPTVVTVHSSRFGMDAKHRLWSRCLPIVLNAATVVHVLGPTGRSTAQRLMSEPHRVAEIPNGVAIPAQRSRVPGDRVVVFAGEVGERKGIDVLFAAWPIVRRTHPGATLVVIGPRAPGFTALCPDGVTDKGPVEPSAVASVIELADVCVLPSRAEAFPMFLLEAMAAGRVCIGSAVGDVPSMLGPDGRIVAPGSADELAWALTEALTLGEEDLQKFGGESRERAEAFFSVDVVLSAMNGLYQNLTAGAPIQPN